jgi:hypothetical protein
VSEFSWSGRGCCKAVLAAHEELASVPATKPLPPLTLNGLTSAFWHEVSEFARLQGRPEKALIGVAAVFLAGGYSGPSTYHP